VVEAAGNGKSDMDDFFNEEGIRTLNVNNRLFKDSGAIMVGACKKDVEGGKHRRHERSNYDSRINCYAWGEGIVTTIPPESETTAAGEYTDSFGGTSGASAIIAGAALLLQSLYQAKLGERLLPNTDDPLRNMRAVLSDPSTGTGQKLDGPRDPIGVMPDLRKIIDKLGLV
jgi:hypothetical protein